MPEENSVLMQETLLKSLSATPDSSAAGGWVAVEAAGLDCEQGSGDIAQRQGSVPAAQLTVPLCIPRLVPAGVEAEGEAQGQGKGRLRKVNIEEVDDSAAGCDD